MVNIPDLSGRLEILQLYLGKISKLARDVDIEMLAKGTTGFTGVNEIFIEHSKLGLNACGILRG